MAVSTESLELKLIGHIDSLQLNLQVLQGLWTEEQYLMLSKQTNHLLEFSDGKLEVLPMPTRRHQMILLLLYELFKAMVNPAGGIVLVAPMRLQVRPGSFREPDVLMLLNRHDPRNQEAFWLGADLVIEVVSPDRPERDLEEKPLDYARAGIPEYWIVNPLDETVTVLVLEDGSYTTHGSFARGTYATSTLLEGMRVDVEAIFSL
nr:Uma2 family endonuclease [Candidatus Chloroploca sp. Khr17]